MHLHGIGVGFKFIFNFLVVGYTMIFRLGLGGTRDNAFGVGGAYAVVEEALKKGRPLLLH